MLPSGYLDLNIIAVHASKASIYIVAYASRNVSIASVLSKKDTTIGVRVDDELLAILQKLADEDERPVAAMARKLIVEALRARKLLK